MAEAPQYPGAPRWVKIFGVVVLVVIAHLVVFALVKGGHGPQQHFQSHDDHPADAG